MLNSDLMKETWQVVATQFPLALWETIYSTLIATLFAVLIGLPLGIILVIGKKDGIRPLNPVILKIIDLIINILRSVPFLILLVVVIPLTRLIVGTAVGTVASIVPLTIASFPFVCRLVESSLNEVDGNLIEMAQSVGASPLQIVWKVLLPEGLPSLLSNLTIAITTILSYQAMSGIAGGGGLGKVAINYGFYRYKYSIMLISVIVLVILVQLIQSIGSFIARKCDKRLK
ncbi:MAG: methionine ABC transporter permease [Erysipelotrichia bacterium]|nr:methionine ABC transporter permease [Erysipelotrichia bacterium]